jgi:hypothetical protein
VTNRDYDAAADWAEHDMQLPENSKTALRGQEAADFGRDLVERSRGGRPPLDPAAAPGQRSRVRQVRLPAQIDADLDTYAEQTNTTPSEVMRDAIKEYLATHRAAC